MIEALRASAFDFLLKPYQQEELELVVDRIRQKMVDGDEKILLQLLSPLPGLRYLRWLL